jgi:hypothetical protein
MSESQASGDTSGLALPWFSILVGDHAAWMTSAGNWGEP